MKVVILAGGLGSRLSEETVVKPKPMIEIGGRPLLWHIMNIYAAHGQTEFVIALGYKAEVIKEYFLNFYAVNNDITVNLASGKTTVHDGKQPPWTVHLVDTGLHTLTGGRVKRLASWLCDGDTFMMTYGDGVADIDIGALLEFHRSHGKLATLTAVRPSPRFGAIVADGQEIKNFSEKPVGSEARINGGFFVLSRRVIDYIEGDQTSWEREPLERLAHDGELMAFHHDGFWQPTDTLREKELLEQLWSSGKPPWKIW
jgi:glucose-1-phosphate cytidylyltransferase